MITASDVRAAEWIVDTSGVADKLQQATEAGQRGRPRKWNSDRTLWIGLILAASEGRTDTRSVYETLCSLSFDDQMAIGFAGIDTTPNGEFTKWRMPISALENTWKRYDKWMLYGNGVSISDEERTRRYDTVMDALQGTMKIFTDIFDTGSYAIDASGIWAWGRSRSNGKGIDSDADWGGKTSKSGKKENFYGYFVHAAAAIAAKPGDTYVPPPIIGAVDLTPAVNTDLSPVTLGLIDRIGRVNEVVVDRLYSNSDVTTWYDELDKRGISQVLDLRQDNHGFTDSDGMLIGVGFVHCPAMPIELGEIRPPIEPSAPLMDSSTKRPKAEREREYAEKLVVYEKKMKIYRSDLRTFLAKVEEREAYVMPYVNQPKGPSGTCRVMCPARAGRVACPRYLDGFREAVLAKLPVIENPPAEEALDDPACCRQTTVTVHLGDKRKHVQADYPNTPEWTGSYSRRSTIEGVFGNIKEPNREDLKRGNNRARHITRATMLIAAIATSYNTRMVRNWYDRNAARRSTKIKRIVTELQQSPLLVDPEEHEKERLDLSLEEIDAVLSLRRSARENRD